MSALLKLLLLAILSTLIAVLWQELSLNHLNNQFPEKNGLISSADEASYHEPPKNWLESGRWKDDSSGSSSFVQRPPGYGMMITPLISLVGDSYFNALKVVNIICFMIGIFLIYGIVRQWGLAEKQALILTAVIGLFPASGSMMYYTITEAVTPTAVLWSVYEWQRIPLKRNYRFVIAGAFLLLMRPQFFPLIVLMLAFSFFVKKKKFIFDLLILLPLSLWLFRVWIYTGALTLHPIYSDDNNSLYREPHQALTELFKVWEYDSRNFHQTLSMTIQYDTLAELNTIPKKYQKEVKPIVLKYAALVDRLEKEGITDGLIREENKFADEVKKMSRKLALANSFQAFIETPIRSALFLLRSSHLHQAVFQTKWRGSFVVEMLRYLSIALIASSFLFAFSLPFLYNRVSLPPQLVVIGTACLLYFLYLIFVQRLNEDRYLYPLIPLVLSISVFVVFKLRNHSGQGFWSRRKP